MRHQFVIHVAYKQRMTHYHLYLDPEKDGKEAVRALQQAARDDTEKRRLDTSGTSDTLSTWPITQ